MCDITNDEHIYIETDYTCANINSGTGLARAGPWGRIDCEVIVSSTHGVCEITRVVHSHTLLGLSLDKQITLLL